MKRILRKSLSSRAQRFLDERAGRVSAHEHPDIEARRLWELQRNRAFNEIRSTLRAMAGGRDRCMYTGDSEGTDIDHFRPLAHFPELAFEWTNLLLACSRCNSNDKRDQFPIDESGQPLLIDPTAEEPLDHLDFIPANGLYHHRTRKGWESIRIYGLNRDVLARGRRASWTVVQACLILYAEAKRAGRVDEMGRYEQAIRDLPHPGVLTALLKIAEESTIDDVDARCLALLREHPEIRSWA